MTPVQAVPAEPRPHIKNDMRGRDVDRSARTDIGLVAKAGRKATAGCLIRRLGSARTAVWIAEVLTLAVN